MSTRTKSLSPRVGGAKRVDEASAGASFDEAAAFLKALGHPLRLRLLCGLLREPRSLSRIGEALQLPLSSIALHLGVLRRRGLLAEERRGAEVIFEVCDVRARAVLELLCAASPSARKAARDPKAAWDWPDRAGRVGSSSRPLRRRRG